MDSRLPIAAGTSQSTNFRLTQGQSTLNFPLMGKVHKLHQRCILKKGSPPPPPPPPPPVEYIHSISGTLSNTGVHRHETESIFIQGRTSLLISKLAQHINTHTHASIRVNCNNYTPGQDVMIGCETTTATIVSWFETVHSNVSKCSLYVLQ